jgi:CubicO group peptidase (beta-lactamase class C family)
MADETPCPEIEVPAADWPDHTAQAPPDRVAELDTLLFPPGLDRADPDRRGTRTDGVVIIHAGAVVYERYAPGWSADRPHLAWSATKSVTGALVGVAVREGLVSLDDSVCEHLEVGAESACQVTVQDLLEFASGFDWHETYEGSALRRSSVLAMLYGEGQADMARFVTGHPLRDPPGTSWMYSSGDTNVLAAIAGRALSPRYGERWPWTALLDPIGMRSAVWERDGAGTYVGSSYLWATPRDLARFGWLLRADGCWNGERLLPEGWVADSTTVSEAIRRKAIGRVAGDVQGRQLWLNQRVPEAGQDTLPWPSAPEDTFAALGHWKQAVVVIPSRDTVVVRTADDRDGTFHLDALLGAALRLVKEMP